MLLVLSCWVLAMVSGLSWARIYTGILTALTALAFVSMQGGELRDLEGWLQLAMLAMTPWLLAASRRRDDAARKRLHAEEALRVTELSEAARSLLSLQHAARQMEHQIAQISDLYHVTKETGGALHLAELFTAALNIAPRLLNAQGLRLIDLSAQSPQVFRAARASDGNMVVTNSHGASEGASATPLLDLEQAIVKRAVSAGGPSSGGASELQCQFPAGISRVAWSVLLRENQPIGVLVADELPEQQLKTLAIVANQLSLQCSRIHLYQQVEALAVTDALTGVFVRYHFMERSREELSRSKRHRLSCSLLMIDLDHFKQKNDTYGHLVGDVVLKDVARLLARNLRDIDLIARFGGEEFLLLLIETAAEQALPVAERLRQLVEVHPIRAYDELLTQTISLGLAGFPEHAQTLEALIERADQALYAAKRAGRNRVCVWSEKLP